MFGVSNNGVPDTNSDNLARSQFGRSTGELRGILKRGTYPPQSFANCSVGSSIEKRERYSPRHYDDTTILMERVDLHGGQYRRISGSEKQQRAEEKRLLGDYGTDPDAVRITPKARSSDKPKHVSVVKSFSTFHPTDTLYSRPSRIVTRSHDSSTRSPYFPSSRPNTHLLSDNENGNPPRKKQKKEMPKEVIEIEDDNPSSSGPIVKPTSPIRSLFNRRSTTRINSQAKQRAIPSISEYMDTEDLVRPTPALTGRREWRNLVGDAITDDFDPEGFTRGSRNERIGRMTMQTTEQGFPRDRHRKPSSTMSAVEITKSCKESKKTDASENGQDDTVRRGLALRESPDELQGDRTIDDSWRTRAKTRTEKATSPGDIHPTFFSASTKSRKPRERPKRKDSADMDFNVKMFRSGLSVIDRPVHIVVDKGERNMILKPAAQNIPSRTFDLKKLFSIEYDDQDDRDHSVMVRLKFSKTADTNTNDGADMIFQDRQETRRFCELLRSIVPNVKGIPRNSGWMEKAFNRAASSNVERASDLKRQSPQGISQSSESNVPLPAPKRSKLSDNLRHGISSIISKISAPSSEQQTLESAWGSKKSISPSDPQDPASSKATGLDEGIPFPVQTYKGTRSSTHVTRSKTRQQRIDIDSQDDEPSELSLDSDRGKRWSKPLVYPKVGKKRAEVEAYDLSRLRDGEFLNDNLIGLYVRFLEHHLQRQHPETVTRIYFFNSYFFASLTNSSKGRKTFNYHAVEKWTRSVDIFSFDYVVVPINENAHWYMAIICNLPALFQARAAAHDGNEEPSAPKNENNDDEQGATDGHEVIGVIPGAGQPLDGKERKLTVSFDTMSLSDKLAESSSQASPKATPTAVKSVDRDEWPEEDENKVLDNGSSQEQTTPLSRIKCEQNSEDKGSKPKSKKKRSHKHRLSLQKYEPTQPVIITFDSLGCSRSPTIRILRDYLEEEAKSKRCTTIDSKEIKGMTAQQIPQQPNYSDCGLYLLVYLEKFVQDPDTFIRKLLQREMDRSKDWPVLKSGMLRRRLRSFLDKLHDEEEREEHGGPLLVDSNPLDILLVDADIDKQTGGGNAEDAEDRGGYPQARNLLLKELERSPTLSPRNPQSIMVTVVAVDSKADGKEVSDKRSLPPATPPSAKKRPIEDKRNTQDAVDPDNRHQSPDSLLDDIEEAVWRDPCESEPGKYKDVVQVPETPPHARASSEAHRSSRERILSSPIILSPSNRFYKSVEKQTET